MSARHFRFTALLTMAAAVVAPATMPAQTTSSWIIRTRAVLSGNSDRSEPAGFTTYSGLALETAVGRRLGRRLMIEASLRSESREIDRVGTTGPAERLGSLELLPLTVMVQYPGFGGRAVRPYFGAGVAFTAAWEKSGVLDSLEVRSHLGPAVQAGLDFRLGERLILDLGVRWNTLTTRITAGATPYTRLRVDPIALALGFGIRL